jgi:hypothetical protein
MQFCLNRMSLGHDRWRRAHWCIASPILLERQQFKTPRVTRSTLGALSFGEEPWEKT